MPKTKSHPPCNPPQQHEQSNHPIAKRAIRRNPKANPKRKAASLPASKSNIGRTILEHRQTRINPSRQLAMGQKHSRATLRLYPAKRTQHQWLQRAQHLAHEAILRNLCGQRKTVRTAYRIALDPQPQNNDPKISRRARILPAALQPKTILL